MNQKRSQQAKETGVAVCIAGAHRSGTSMLTRLLHSSGLDLGPESELMPAQADNPDGFWENLRFVALNDEVLNELGGAWDLPPSAQEDFGSPKLDPLRTKAQLLIAGFDPTRTWGWKDPRNSLTLPFWRTLLPNWKVVVMVRNPLEVAYSMRSRNGTSYSFGLRLWEIYYRRLLGSTSASERLVSHYDSFFYNPAAELERIARFVGLPESSASAAASLVTSKRRHTHFSTDQLIDARVSTQIVELYLDLAQEAGRASNNLASPSEAQSSSKAHSAKAKVEPRDLLPGAISRLNVSVPNGEAIRREVAQLRGDKISNRTELERLQGELRRSAEELARREGRITEMERNAIRLEQERQSDAVRQEQARATLQEQLQASAATAARSDERVKNLQGEIGNLHAEMQRRQERLESEMEQIRNRFLQTNDLLHTRSISLTENEARVIELTAQLRRQLHALRKLSRLLDDAGAAAARLRSSRRWKLANPIAALTAALSSKGRLPGYGHLEKIVSTYSKWRSAHPEVGEIEDALQALNPRASSPGPAPVKTDPPPNGEAARRLEPRAPLEPIAFPIYDEVEISIIIPVCNQFSFTQACLASLQRHAANERFEVIVVDDGSTDSTAGEMDHTPGVIYLRNENNVGFIASCNRGAEKARGRFLVFLNNDTEVTAGWLHALRETFALEPRAGFVGAKLVFPDGSLQEAGGIIWRDATGWNFGKFDDPEKPEYNFLREVDYCSAACVMVPKAVFDSVGGFDSKFAPAYYEDVDLAFKIRRTGARVLYQPLSEVIHFEGATGGTDLSSGTKKYQEINRTKFAECWSDVLARKATNGDLTTHEALAPGQRRILVIDHHLPMPDRDAGSLRMFHILDLLHQLGHRVTFVPDNLADIPPYADDLQKRGIEVIYHPYLKSVRGFLEKEGHKFDAVLLSRCDFAKKHIADVRQHAPQSRIIFDTVDLHFLRQQREAELTQDAEIKRGAEEKQREEYSLIDEADETWVVSDFERQLLHRDHANKSIEVVPTIVETPGSATPFSLRHGFLFIGSFQHAPNVDAVLYFVNAIYPLISPRLPQAKFYIIGDKAPPDVIALASERIIVTGLVPEVEPLFESVKLSVAPLRFGAGVKGKINQSMGLGVPVVATSLATEGMTMTNREDILVADSPADFAEALIELYESEILWQRLSENGLAKTKALYSREAARDRLAGLFRDAAFQPSHARRTAKDGFSPLASSDPISRSFSVR
ncbi:MAG: glycosyltransferase [Spartobacteria bacterium]